MVIIETGTATMSDSPNIRKYSISEIARILGVEEKHIYLFAHKGLIRPITSQESEAHFTDIDCARLQLISRAEKLGYSSDSIFNLIGASEEVLDAEDPLSACEQYAMAKYKQIYDELGRCEPLEQLNKQCDLKLVTGYIKHLKGIRSGDPQPTREPDRGDPDKSVATTTVKEVNTSNEDAGQQRREPAPTAEIRRYSVAKYWEYMKKVEDLQQEVAADSPQDEAPSQDAPQHTVDDAMTLMSVLEESAGPTTTPGTTSFSHVREREEPHPRLKLFDKQQSWSVWILTGVFLTLLASVYFLISNHNDEVARKGLPAESVDSQTDAPAAEPPKTTEAVARPGPDETASRPGDESADTPVPSVKLDVQDLSLKHDGLHHIYQADFSIAKNDLAGNRESVTGYAFVNLKFSDEGSGPQSLLLPSGEMQTGQPTQVRKGARFTIKRFMQMRVEGVSDLPPNNFASSRVLVYSPEGALLFEKDFDVAIQPFISSSGQHAAASEKMSATATQTERVEPREPVPPPAIVPDTPPPAADRPDSGIKEETIALTRPASGTRKPSPPPVTKADVKPSPRRDVKQNRPTKQERSRPAVKIRSTGNPEAARWEQKSYNAAVKGDFDQAIENASKAIEMDPGRINPYVNRSWAYLEKNMLQAAIQDCDTALSIDPQNAFAYNNRGLAYQRKKRNSKAEADYRKACNLGLDLGCQNLDVLTKESRIAKLIDQSQEAFNAKDWNNVIRLTTEAIRLDPQNAVAYTNRSAAYAQKDFLNKALKDSNVAVKFNPDFPLAYNNRGYVLELLGNNRKAAADYLKSCSLGSDLGCKNFERLNRTK
jgi:tetratricopeptide (TPR) repeat protein/DNA-binding transcriptional MerR regulator